VVSVYARQLGRKHLLRESIRVVIVPDQGQGNHSARFMGFGLRDLLSRTAGLLSASNQRMLQFIRTLGANGVIRVGGIMRPITPIG